jgi:SAM-dependent methyltransferase
MARRGAATLPERAPPASAAGRALDSRAHAGGHARVSVEPAAMRADEHERMFRAETRHFWFVGTRKVIVAALERALGPRLASARVLDIGCGTGFTLTRLPAGVRSVGLDASPAALSLARERAPGSSFVRGSAYALPFADGSFDAVLALDVLEHLDDDLAAARELRRVLAPGGAAIVTVPAFQGLWSAHDEALEHRRRYRLPQIEAVLREAGLRIEHGSYYNFFLFPVVAATRMAERARGALWPARRSQDAAGTDLRVPAAPVNAALAALLGAERAIAPRVRLPFGVSCLVLARA